jgi:hypothetical protein
MSFPGGNILGNRRALLVIRIEALEALRFELYFAGLGSYVALGIFFRADLIRSGKTNKVAQFCLDRTMRKSRYAEAEGGEI